VSIKEKAVASVFAVIALYLGIAGYWFFAQRDTWNKARKSYEREAARYKKESRLIGEKNKWETLYEEEKSHIPTFADGVELDIVCQRKVEDFATKNNIFISNRQAGKSVAGSDVEELEELEIDVKVWEGSLEALVRFMYELETTSEGMFDLKSLNFKPSTKKGYLKGSFVLTCAFMRGESE
jgi:hypothetical protein